jgi:hypothetical protein
VGAGHHLLRGFGGLLARFPRHRAPCPKLLPAFDFTSRSLFVAAAVILLSPWPMSWYGMGMSAVALTLFPCSSSLAHGSRCACATATPGISCRLGADDHRSMTRALQAAGLLGIDSRATHLYALGVLLQAAALVLGLAERMMRTRRERDQAQQAAAHDALTGVLNRRALDARLHAACAEACRGGPRPALLFLDIDHFKSVNDNYGHAGGDACLVETARRIQSQLADGDCARALGRRGVRRAAALGRPGDGAQDFRGHPPRRVGAADAVPRPRDRGDDQHRHQRLRPGHRRRRS